MKQKLVIIGTNEAAEMLFDYIVYYDLFDVVGFSVHKKYMKNSMLREKPIYPIEELDSFIDKSDVKIFVAIVWNRLNSIRRKVYEEMDARGYSFANIISPTAVLMSNKIGQNCWFRDFVVVRSNATIGDNCFVEDYAHIGTGARVESHCFCGTRSLVAGECVVGEQSFLGISSTLLETVTIGKKCIVGAGTVVKRNLPNNSVIKVSSDNYITKQYLDIEIEGKLDVTKRIR